MTKEDKEFPADAEALDFVYAGITLGKGDKKLIRVVPIGPDWKLRPAQVYEWKRSRERRIGGIYTGAHFTPTQAIGLDAATYKGNFADQGRGSQALVLEWAAKDDALKQRLAAKKAEAAGGALEDMRRAMLPMRRAYQEMTGRLDMNGAAALEQLVSKVLRTPPRSDERGY